MGLVFNTEDTERPCSTSLLSKPIALSSKRPHYYSTAALVLLLCALCDLCGYLLLVIRFRTKAIQRAVGIAEDEFAISDCRRGHEVAASVVLPLDVAVLGIEDVNLTRRRGRDDAVA